MGRPVVPVGFHGAVVEIAARRGPASQQLLFLLQGESFWVILYKNTFFYFWYICYAYRFTVHSAVVEWKSYFGHFKSNVECKRKAV